MFHLNAGDVILLLKAPSVVGMLLCIHNWMGPLTTEAVKVTYITLYVAMDEEITIANF